MGEGKSTGLREREAAHSALVVGAGVSGCACAAMLASRGVRVTVINGALDAVGQPAFGPDIVPASGRLEEIREVLASLPGALRSVWASASVVPAGAPFACVDRRMLSIETKRVLEWMPGLEFRQGLVNNLRPSGPVGAIRVGRKRGGVAVETVFGEVFEAEAVVIAVGLGLGGRVSVGENLLPGGRYGEASVDGLRAALEMAGARFQEVAVCVGPRFLWGDVVVEREGEGREAGGDGLDRGRPFVGGGERSITLPLARLMGAGGDLVEREVTRGWEGEPEDRRGLLAECGLGESTAGCWPGEYPPAPHWTEGLWADAAVVVRSGDGVVRPSLSPDGVATGEVHLSGDGEWCGVAGVAGSGEGVVDSRPMVTRLGHCVGGLAIANLGSSGRLLAEEGVTLPVWITGRAAGAAGYLESLVAGVRTGVEVATVLKERA